MRIGIVVSGFPMETFIQNKVKQLILRGHTIYIFTRYFNVSLYNRYFKNNKNCKVVVINKRVLLLMLLLKPHLWNRKLTEKNLAETYLLKMINCYQLQIVHFEFSTIAASYLHILDKLQPKLVVSCRGTNEKVRMKTDERMRESLKEVFTKAYVIHCVSEDIRTTIYPYVNNNSKIFINRPAIDTNIFRKFSTIVNNKTPVILSIGRLIFQKGYHTGLQTIKHLHLHTQHFQWRIIGDGPLYSEIQFHIYNLDLHNHVTLLKHIEVKDIITELNNATIFFLPSVTEGIANVVLEAMSMQLPVVSTSCGGMPELISCGKNGLMADVYNYKKLAEHIKYLLDHPEEAKAMGKAARERILEAFTLEQQTNTFEHIYQQLLTA